MAKLHNRTAPQVDDLLYALWDDPGAKRELAADVLPGHSNEIGIAPKDPVVGEPNPLALG